MKAMKRDAVYGKSPGDKIALASPLTAPTIFGTAATCNILVGCQVPHSGPHNRKP